MLELTTINTTELANKKLGTQLNNIKKAVDTGNNQQWKIADAIATIVDDELFVDDFETEGNLEDCPTELIDRLVYQFRAIDFNTIEVILIG